MRNDLPKLVVVSGPTASGKTDLGIWLAKKFDGEIVSADSRLVYKELDIGTAKPINENGAIFISQGVVHHMIDVTTLKKDYNAAIYKKEAIKKIRSIQKKGKLPFLVGGTGLYIDAVVKNIDFPEISQDKKLRQELEEKSLDELYSEYEQLDPSGAEKIDKKNKRRLIRAIEVCRMTGDSFWENRRLEEPIFDCLELGIAIEKDILFMRIKKRISKMIKMGLENEAKKLIKKYGNVPALETIGYAEWKEYINKNIDKKDLEKIKERMAINTNKFAKRQMTWFKRNKDINWIANKKEAEKLVKQFLKRAD
ncbi:MAG: tRNA (adenosine(37)-N6)-dimethylallyltransferase MiaA [Candidatus Paceibacterota bacterium]